MRVYALMVVVFLVGVLSERNDSDKDFVFWAIVGAGAVATVAVTNAFRSRGGIGATG